MTAGPGPLCVRSVVIRFSNLEDVPMKDSGDFACCYGAFLGVLWAFLGPIQAGPPQSTLPPGPLARVARDSPAQISLPPDPRTAREEPKTPPRGKACLCSPQCVCGCNEGGDCRCRFAPQGAPVALPSYNPGPARFVPSFRPSSAPRLGGGGSC